MEFSGGEDMNTEQIYEVGELVYLPVWPDKSDRCTLSGRPRFRPAYGVVLEIFTEYDGSRNRMKLMVEGTEHYCHCWNLRKLEVA